MIRALARTLLLNRALKWWLPPLFLFAGLNYVAFLAFKEGEMHEATLIFLISIAPLLARYVGTTGKNAR